MGNEVQSQIDVKQKEIQNLKGRESAEAEIKKYQETFITAVDTGQRDLETAESSLQVPESKAYLESAGQEVLNDLGEMAEKGREILLAGEDSKGTVKEKSLPSMADLSSKLEGELSQLKPAIESYRTLEEIETKDLAEVEKSNEKLNESEGTVDAGEIYKSKGTLLEKLNRIESGISGHEKSKEYQKKLSKKRTDLFQQIEKEKNALAVGPIATQKAIREYVSSVDAYVAAVEAAESNPTMDTVNKVRSMELMIDPNKVWKENLEEMPGESYAYLKNLNQYLDSAHAEATNRYDLYRDSFSETEKDGIRNSAKKMIEDVTSAEKEELQPQWKKYETESMRTDIEGDELKKLETTETGIMSGYQMLKMTMSPFVEGKNFAKLVGDPEGLDKKISDESKLINQKIRQIEVNRQTRLSTKSLQEMKLDDNTTQTLLMYVIFTGEEKDGKIYTFNSAFDALPEDKKRNIRMAVESLIARDENIVKGQTQKEVSTLTKSPSNFDKITQVLGEKGKKYAEGMKLFSEGKHEEAAAAFQAYTGQEFSKDELDLHEGVIQDAKEKIALISGSANFYNGLIKYGEGDLNEAIKLLRTYLGSVPPAGSENANLHAEQIEKAKDILKMIGLRKVEEMSGLLNDVKEWKRSKEGLGGRRADVKDVVQTRIDLEDDKISEEISKIRQRVASGEDIDFNQAFAELKTSVATFLNEQSSKAEIEVGDSEYIGQGKFAKRKVENNWAPENNLIDKLGEVYEGLSSSDPKIRRGAMVKFAKDFHEVGAFEKSHEYLDKALQGFYKKNAVVASREEVMHKMMNDPAIMADIRKGADFYLDKLKQENPAAPIDQLRQQAEQLVFNSKLNEQCGREIRHFAVGDKEDAEALKLYADWVPYDPSTWWKPWTYSDVEYDNFKRGVVSFAFSTVVMLPVGAMAGGVAKGLTSGMGSLLARGAGAAEAATAIAEGGLATLSTGSRAFAALEPAVQQAILANRVALGTSWGAGLLTEGGMLYAGAQLVQEPGAGSEGGLTGGGFAENVFKALAFRGFGALGQKLFGKAIESGGARGVKAMLAMEGLSAGAATGLDAAWLYASDHPEQASVKTALLGFLGNAMGSLGSHIGHGLFSASEHKTPPEAAKNPEKISKEGGGDMGREEFLGLTSPDSVKRVELSANGQIIINGKKVNIAGDAYRDAMRTLPKEVQEKIGTLYSDAIAAFVPAAESSTASGQEKNPDASKPPQPEFVIPAELAKKIKVSPEKLTPDEEVIIANKVKEGTFSPDMLMQLIGKNRIIPTQEMFDFIVDKAGYAGLQFAHEKGATISAERKIKVLKEVLEQSDGALKGAEMIKDGLIDTNTSGLQEIMVQSNNGITICLTLIYEGKMRMNEPMLKAFLANENALAIIESLFMNDNPPVELLDTALGIEQVKKMVQERKEIIEDSGDMIVMAIDYGAQFSPEIQKSLARIESGAKDPANGMDSILSHLKERDPDGYRILAASHTSMDVNYIEAIIQGNKTEFIDGSGKKVIAYDGGYIAAGGMGTVHRCAYVSEGGSVLEYGVMKRPFDHTKAPFEKEKAGAELVASWDSPYINKPLHVGEGVIILETGENAKSLDKRIDTLSDYDAVKVIIDALRGVAEYQKQGYIHGDLKEPNILVFDTPDGPRAQLIDNTPYDQKKIANIKKPEKGFEAPPWPWTLGYSDPMALTATMAGGEWRAWDSNSMGKILRGANIADRNIPAIKQATKALCGFQHWGEPDNIQHVISQLEASLPGLSRNPP